MPFPKRTVEPPLLCRRAVPRGDAASPFDDLCAVSNVALSRTLRQLSDLAKHASSLFHELENELVSTNHRVWALRAKIGRLQQSASELDPKQEAVPVSNLDVESKLCGHYQSAWHLQRNIFLPGTRPACVEELHHRAKQRLPALYRDQQQRQEASEREQKVIAPFFNVPPIPVYAHTVRIGERLQTFESVQSSSTAECCHFARWSRKTTADPDQEDALLGQRPKCPVPNVPSTLDKQTNWTGTLPLPTPEDRMKSQSRAIASCVVPIDVTEEVPIDAPPSEMTAFLRAGFDREASVRYSLVHSQSVLQRRRRPRRRKVAVGVPRRGHNEADSDESPVARERTVIVHASPGTCEEDLTLAGLNTRDSGCQTEDLLASVAAPSRRRIGAQRGRGGNVPLSHSTGNISSLPDDSDGTFSASAGNRLRSRSLPREGGRSADDDEEGEDELSPFETEDFLPMPGDCKIKDNIDGPDDKEASERQLGRPERQLGSLKFKQAAERQGHVWTERGRTRLPRKSDVESCEISSSSDTFSSPVHSNTGALASQVDHKDDHQSSSGNWSGSSSTCPSQTSETMPPAASPPLTGSSHCDSELSLNATPNASEDSAGVSVDPYSGDQRRGLGADQTESCASTATDMLDDAGVSTASEGEWSCAQYGYNTCCHPDFSPEHSRVEEDCPSLDCPSFTSIATLESLDRPPSEKADTVSHFSVDAEGYYTSMHFDCGLKGSKNLSHNYASADQHEEEHGGPARLGRCSLSLRKLKVKPSPPERSTSLKKISSHAGASAETCQPKITAEQLLPVSSKERKLQSGSTEPYDQTEGEEPVQLWGAQSSNDTQGVDLIGPTETHSFKDEGAVQADYADLWLLNDLKSSDPYHSLSNSSTATGTTVIECIKSQQSSESQTSQSGSRVTTPTLPPVESELRLPSPEKLAGLASPSSGYSSQSETPTSCIPLAFFPNPNPLSPTRGKRKPKVPERRSSLTSLRQHVSKGDLELPIIPPTHLNLSALHSVSKPLTYRNLPVLHQNKTKVAAEQTEAGRPSTANMQPDSWSPFAVTPMVLRSVQLRSVGKPVEGKHSHSCTDAATRPKCPKARKPPPCGTFSAQATSQESCDSLSTPGDEVAFVSLASQVTARNRYDRLAPAPLLNMAAFSATSEQVRKDGIVADVSQIAVGKKVPAEPHTSTSKETYPQSSVETDKDQPVRSEPTEEATKTRSPLGHRGIDKSADLSFSQVPDFIHQSSLESTKNNQIGEAGSQEEESETWGVPTRSASEESVDEGSTPDTEGYFSKESTPSDPLVSPLTDDSRTEEEVFLSPSKSRTTEDLFAMIHRSKRKVFGRKDSGETPLRSSLSMSSASASPPIASSTTPVTPTTPTNSQRASGPLYRSIKKSSTSNEEFKLLLLKKGSRSDSSYRMSATEILKSPIAPRSFGDPQLEGSRHQEEFPSPVVLLSPERVPEHLPSPYPKAIVEGFSTKPFPTAASSRQGRSRIPPAASSSRYSTRSRLYTAPMQAISEGETENSDGSPHDDRSS
ncbi:LOW QUALITY PROTEIN: Nance-Horan syndrome protein [Electrophorus electricus]|uniref:LOW QUALITY PROTEIN: Nance-Horan syndrome protein n=1 Tax=Electrophorus electricus TaxID=8005 RepID=UPI0015CFF0FA|nr:LOW QUALITY PROTEIN: Nance-Horan syndrome protein [Electrophorus electricus]